nr:unnamed protein product [Callosobruchus analis]
MEFVSSRVESCDIVFQMMDGRIEILNGQEAFVSAQWDLFPLEKQMDHLTTLVNLQLDCIKLQSDNLSQVALQKIFSKEKEDIDRIIQRTRELPRVGSLEEIAGQWEVKKIMRSFAVLPRSQPQLYVNHKVCNSILPFGPPGTGKTRLVHALASEAKAVLHCINFIVYLKILDS